MTNKDKELERLAKAARPAKGYRDVVNGCRDCRPIRSAQKELGGRGSDVLALIERLRDLERLLGGLHAVVKGECPSLLEEDSGGDARMAMDIDEALGGVVPEHKGTARLTLEQLQEALLAMDVFPDSIPTERSMNRAKLRDKVRVMLAAAIKEAQGE